MCGPGILSWWKLLRWLCKVTLTQPSFDVSCSLLPGGSFHLPLGSVSLWTINRRTRYLTLEILLHSGSWYPKAGCCSIFISSRLSQKCKLAMSACKVQLGTQPEWFYLSISVHPLLFTPNVPCCCRFHSQSCSSTAGESVLSCLLSSKPKATFLRISHFFPNRLNPSTAKRGVGINPRRNAGFNHKPTINWVETKLFLFPGTLSGLLWGNCVFIPLSKSRWRNHLVGWD